MSQLKLIWSFITLILFSLVPLLVVGNPVNNTSNGVDSKASAAAAATLSKLVVFSFDGFRNDYVNEVDTPNLYALANDGVRGHMKSTFVTKTYPNHQSIATGLYQSYHGIINNEFVDPQLNNQPFDVDKEEGAAFWWDQFNVSVPIYIANQLYEPAIRFSGAVQWPGSFATYSDGTGHNTSARYRVHYLKNYQKEMSWFARIDLALDWLSNPDKPANLAFIYIPEPDSTAHEYGPFSKEVKEQVRHIDQAVGYFRKRLAEVGISHRTNVVLLSDHGMAEVRDSPERVFHIETCAQHYPGLSFKLYGVSPVFSIMPLSGPTQSNVTASTNVTIQVRDTLNQCAKQYFGGKFTVYLQENIPAEYHYSNNRRILPLFLLADDGHEIMFRNASGWRPKGFPVWGNHGYNNSLPSMRPLFIAQGPRFKTDYIHPTVFENVDLYPLWLHLLQIPVSQFPSNGSYALVRDMLTNKLYANGDDYLLAHSRSRSNGSIKAVQLLIYLGIGFAAITFIGVCFVLSAGFSHKTSSRTRGSMLSGRGAGDSPNFVSALFNRFVRSSDSSGRSRLRNSHYDNEYRMFSNGPKHHLDSSFDTEEDEDEDELYSVKAGPNGVMAARKGKQRKNNSSSNLTDIDWDIIGTGLDIDLSSQLSPGMKAPRDYRDEPQEVGSDESYDMVSSGSQVKVKKTMTKKDYESLLIETTDTDSDGEELKFAIDRANGAKGGDKDDDDGLKTSGDQKPGGSRLIDI